MNRGGVPIVHGVEDSACKLISSESEYAAASYRSSQSSLGEKVEVDAFQQTPPESEYSHAAHILSQSSGEKVEVNMCNKQSLPGLECGAAAHRLSQSSSEKFNCVLYGSQLIVTDDFVEFCSQLALRLQAIHSVAYQMNSIESSTLGMYMRYNTSK